MKNKNKSLEKQMRLFLKKLDNKESINYQDPIIRQCVYECDKLGYVSGFRHCSRMADNSISFDYSNPCIEKAGYEFLYPPKNWIEIGTLIASVLTALGVLLQLVLEFV